MHIELNEKEVKEYRELHRENMDALLKCIGGKTDIGKPQPITEPQASCLISHVLGNQTRMLALINRGEKK